MDSMAEEHVIHSLLTTRNVQLTFSIFYESQQGHFGKLKQSIKSSCRPASVTLACLFRGQTLSGDQEVDLDLRPNAVSGSFCKQSDSPRPRMT